MVKRILKKIYRGQRGEFVVNILAAVFLLIVLAILPFVISNFQWAELQNAATYWESQGYVAYGDSSGNLIPLSGDNLSDLGSATSSWKDAYIDGQLYASTGRTATYTIAASDAPAHVKAQADYVVVGDADDEILAAMGTGNVNISFSIGTFNISSQISTWGKPNVLLEGSGWDTTLRMADGANLNPMLYLWWYNGCLKDIKLDGNKANQTGGGPLVIIDSPYDDVFITVENCLFVDSYGDGVRTANSNANSRFSIRKNTFLGCNQAGIFVGSTNALIEGNHIIDCAAVGESAITLYDGSGATIVDNIIEGAGHATACHIYASIHNYLTIANNKSMNSAEAGIACSDSSKLTITGNIVLDSSSGGILLDTACHGATISQNVIKGAGSNSIHIGGPDYCTITGNIIEDGYDNGIDTGGSIGITIVGNTIRGIKLLSEGHGICLSNSSGVCAENIIEYCALNGIVCGGENKDLRIVNNLVKNCRQDTTGGFPVEAGIAVHGFSSLECTGNLIEGNRIFDNQGGTSLLTADATSGQKNVTVADGAQFKVYQAITISDDTPDTEDNIIQSISGNILTMRANLTNNYTVAQNAVVNGRQTQDYGIGIRNDGPGGTVVETQIINNDIENNLLGPILFTLTAGTTELEIHGNRGYIDSGELRTASGSLTAGNANAIAFAWHNPEAQDILITKVVIEITTAGGTSGSQLDVGIADDATGTNRGTEFFDDLLLNSVQVNDSWVVGDGGTQTKWVFCQDTASATDGWIVGQILTQNAASLVGKWYIEYVGR